MLYWRPGRTHVEDDGRPLNLTDRQREVLGLLTSGLTDKAMAHRLGISERCIRRHIERSSKILGAHGRAQLAALAVAFAIVDVPLGAPASAARAESAITRVTGPGAPPPFSETP